MGIIHVSVHPEESMTRTRRILAHTVLDDIRPWVTEQHAVDRDKIAALVAYVRDRGEWTLPPVLVIEDEGNGATVLDGHHRCAAARVLSHDPESPVDTSRIPAYVVSVADYCRILEHHFDGSAPARLSDLDKYIHIAGKPYRRTDDGHT